jgi:hypothetical protein
MVLFTKEYLPTSVDDLYWLQDRASPYFAPPVPTRLHSLYLFSGLGVDSAQNGLTVIYFVTVGWRDIYRSKQKTQEERQCVCVCVLRNTTERSCNHCCDGRAISNAYPEYVFVALGIRNEIRMRHIVITGLPGFTVFSTLSHIWNDLRKRSYYT